MNNLEELMQLAMVQAKAFTAMHRAAYDEEFPGCEGARMGGDAPAPTTQETTAQMLQAYTQYLPGLMSTTNAQVLPTAQAQFDVNKQLAPQFAQLQSDLYSQYGSDLNRIGADILKQNQLAQAQADTAVLQGPGAEAVRQGLALQREADPEYFATRTAAADKIARLLESIDLTGLSGSERAEVSRGLAQQQEKRGLSTAPSQIATIEAAGQFGSALQNKRNALGQALDTATNFLGQSRTGIDAFQVATGKPSMPNPGGQQFQGIDKTMGNQAYNTAGNFLNQIGQSQQTQMNINADRRDSLDRVNSTLNSTLGNL